MNKTKQTNVNYGVNRKRKLPGESEAKKIIVVAFSKAHAGSKKKVFSLAMQVSVCAQYKLTPKRRGTCHLPSHICNLISSNASHLHLHSDVLHKVIL
jgi:hypothetical protein